MSIDQPLLVEVPAEVQPLCKNCGTSLAGHYCSHCGQPDRPLDPSFHDLIHDGTHEFLHLDGKIVATLRALVFHPGRLTAEYFAGRRARYIGPIRLYLTLSLIFFIVAAHAGKSSPMVVRKSEAVPISIEIDGKHQSALEQRLSSAVKKASEDPEVFKHAFLSNTSKVMFLIVPLFALGLRFAYRNRRRRYPGFVYFSLHYHSVVFLGLTITDLFEFTRVSWLSNWAENIVWVWLFVYLFVALRKVFGGSKRNTALRMLALGGFYLPCFVAGLVAAAMISLFSM